MFAAFCVLVAASCEESATQQPELGPPPYADTEWASVHAGPRNDDYVPLQLAGRYQHKWTALTGAATPAPVTIGPEGNIYQTTGQGPGTSTLHAFDRDGTVLWNTPPWTTVADFDSCAVLQAAIVDDAGDLYVSDCNQFWAFRSDSTVKWTIDLPPPPAGAPFQDGSVTTPVMPLITAFFTKDGSVGGVTIFGDVVIVNRADGASVAPVINLPGGPAPPTMQTFPPTLWQGGFLDPDIIDLTFNVFFAGLIESANTPAVDPESGRIFVTGTDVTPGVGTLYGLDFTPGAPGRIEIATTSVIGPGSGSSPALSPDGSAVYVSDDSGSLYSFDAGTGMLNWSLPLAAAPGSASVGPDGTVYVLAGDLTAVTPDGDIEWVSDMTALAEERLPDDPDFSGRFALPNGIPTVTDNALLVPYFVGYSFNIAGADRTIIIEQLYLTIDLGTGALLPGSEPYLAANGSNEGFAIPLRDGTVLVSSGEFFTTGIAPIAEAVNELLPDGFQVLEPVGGLEALSSVPE
jgi:outer membrane protein assembly factor BamB